MIKNAQKCNIKYQLFIKGYIYQIPLEDSRLV